GSVGYPRSCSKKTTTLLHPLNLQGKYSMQLQSYTTPILKPRFLVSCLLALLSRYAGLLNKQELSVQAKSSSLIPLWENPDIKVIHFRKFCAFDQWETPYDFGKWSTASRINYNLQDAPTKYTVQVCPNAWTAILVSLDNQGMWNIRSAAWERQYLGQQFCFRVWNPTQSLANEYNIPSNALLCGKTAGLHH
ncbi:Multicopper oxidase, C-terminal, partial [Dillenia turbinata]